MVMPMDKVEAEVERTMGHWSHHVGFDEQSLKYGPNYHINQSPDLRARASPQPIRSDYFTKRQGTGESNPGTYDI